MWWENLETLDIIYTAIHFILNLQEPISPFTASCENSMSLSVPGVPGPFEKFPHSSQLNFE
jgi:hypothetical protein